MAKSRCWISAVLIAVLFAVVGCSSSTTEDPTPPPTTSETPSPSAAPDVQLPDSPLGEATGWLLETLNGSSGPTAEEAEARFADIFLAELPAAEVEALFASLREAQPFTLLGWQETSENNGAAHLDSGQGEVSMMVNVNDEGLIDGLFFSSVEEAPQVSSPAEAAGALADRAEHSAFLFADGQCTPSEAQNEENAMPIGSMFKLYVLGAVVTEVENGTLNWDDELTLTDELKSLPSGTLQDEPAGTTVTVREAAEQMISISDNTATDLLIDAVGRATVEAELATMGHHAPEMNMPFLTTREMFQLAMSDEELREQWQSATPEATDTSADVTAAQREVIADLPAWDREIDQELASVPFWSEGLDWFATATDVCRAHQVLQEKAETDAGEPVRDILSKNPGVSVPDADFVGFKGGSSVGEIGLSFYVEQDDQTQVLVLMTAGSSAESVPADSWIANIAEQVLQNN